MHKRYINVAYKDREMAKRLGAKWDPSVKRWYCPPGSALAKVYSWRKAGSAKPAGAFGGVPASGGPLGDAAVADATPVSVSQRRVPRDGQLSFLA